MQVATKVCSICAIDLIGQKRIKDPRGNYYCPACWEARVSAARAVKVLNPDPIILPPTAPEPVEIEPQIQTLEILPTPPVPIANTNPPAPIASENVLLNKLGFLCLGAAAAACFDIWPLIQVNNHAQQVTISYKGILLGWMVLTASLASLLPENRDIEWTQGRTQWLGDKIPIAAVLVLSLGMTAATVLYVQHEGYRFGL